MIEITGMYARAADAERAFHGLKQQGFSDDVMTIAAPGAAERLWIVAIRPPFGTGGMAMEILDRFGPIARSIHHERDRDPGLDAIARLSGPASPGAISTLSRSKPAGAISTLSRSKSPGAIATLSRAKPPGAISTLSRSKSPGAISTLSRSKPTGAIAKLSSRWFLSSFFGLPLLTRAVCNRARRVAADGSVELHETTVI